MRNTRLLDSVTLFSYDLLRPPARVAYRVFIRLPSGLEFPVDDGGDHEQAVDDWIDVKDAARIRSALRVDVIFRPDTDAARRSMDAMPIWGGVLVAHDVPVITGGG